MSRADEIERLLTNPTINVPNSLLREITNALTEGDDAFVVEVMRACIVLLAFRLSGETMNAPVSVEGQFHFVKQIHEMIGRSIEP